MLSHINFLKKDIKGILKNCGTNLVRPRESTTCFSFSAISDSVAALVLCGKVDGIATWAKGRRLRVGPVLAGSLSATALSSHRVYGWVKAISGPSLACSQRGVHPIALGRVQSLHVGGTWPKADTETTFDTPALKC